MYGTFSQIYIQIVKDLRKFHFSGKNVEFKDEYLI
jgi:hypothetical protein